MKESIRKEVKGDLEKSFLTLGTSNELLTSNRQRLITALTQMLDDTNKASILKHQ